MENFQGFWTHEEIEYHNSIQDWVFITVYRLSKSASKNSSAGTAGNKWVKINQK